MFEIAESEDSRIEYISGITCLSLDVDRALWDDMIWREENQLILKDFFDTPTTRLLYVFVNNKENLAVSNEFPQTRPLPKKSIYFLKYEDTAIPTNNFRTLFMAGSLTNTPLKQFLSIYEKAISPILCNLENNKEWPEEVANDIVLHFQDFQKKMHYNLGKAQGKTYLPVVEIARKVESLNLETLTRENISDPQLRLVLDAIGTMVVDWTNAIDEVLDIESNLSDHNAVSGGPITEIVYWRNRMENLLFIYSQINDPLVKRIGLVLEKISSIYLNGFRKLLRDVIEALAEAEDITNHLEKLHELFVHLESCEFDELIKDIPEAIEKITICWSASKYFSSIPTRIRILLQKICNLLMDRAHSYINPTQIFRTDRKESEEKVTTAKIMFNQFIASYSNCRETMKSPFEVAKLYPWEFPDDRVFKKLNKFIERLDNIEELFEAADVYFKLPSYNLVGLLLIPFKAKVDEIYSEFRSQYQFFIDSKYDPLNLEIEDFERHLEEFHAKIQDLDHRLGSAICYYCISCPLTHEALRVVELLGDLFKRPLLREEFESCIPHIIENINAELNFYKKMYDDQIKLYAEEKSVIVPYKHLPAVSGCLMWSRELQTEMHLRISYIEKMKQRFFTSQDIENIFSMHSNLVKSFERFEDEVFNDWKSEIDDKIKSKLEKPLIKNNEEDIIMHGYDYELTAITTDIKYLLQFGWQDIPPEAKKFNDRSEDIRLGYSFLLSIVEWYNQLSKDLVPSEENLISEKWKLINSLVQDGKTKDWLCSDLRDYCENLNNLIKTVFECVYTAKSNIDKVKKMIESWSTKPLYERKQKDGFMDLEIYGTDHVREQYFKIKETALAMERIKEENLKLFNCDLESQITKDYVVYLEEIMENGLKDAAACSLKYFFDNTNAENPNLVPLIKVAVDIKDEGEITIVKYTPSLERRDSGSLMKNLEGAIDKIFDMGLQIKRLTNKKSDYYKALLAKSDLYRLKTEIIQHVFRATKAALKGMSDKFDDYEVFWALDIATDIDQFTLFGIPTAEVNEEDNLDEEMEQAMVSKPATEKDFLSQIADFDRALGNMGEENSEIIIDSWLLLDISLFKEKVISFIRKWIAGYKQRLIELKNSGKLAKPEKEGE